MPIYEYYCEVCDERYEAFHTVATYKDATPHTCGKVGERRIFTAQLVCTDLPGYTSPIDGRWIEGRRARREDLRRSGCRPYDPGEKEEFGRRRVAEEAKFEKSVEETLDREITLMPTRKRELLEQEARCGATAEVVRLSPNGD